MIIRKFTIEDYNNLHRLLSDPQVMRFLEPPFSPEKTKTFLEDAGMSDPPLIYAVEEEGAFLGYVIYHDYDADSVEIGWVLLPEYWNKGYATKMTRMLISKAAADKKAVVIECVPEQEATKHIAEKTGFVFEGTRDGLDHYMMGKHRAR